MAAPSPRARVLLLAVLALGVASLAAAFDLRAVLRAALERIAGLGPWGPPLFVALYVAASVFLVPASLLTLGAGAVFRLAEGSLLVSVASTAGATAAFLVGRYLARDWVAARLGADPRFKAIDEAVAREGWKIVLLTRLSPAFPFILLNYALSLTRVRLRDYVAATWLGMLPGTVLFVYVGSLAGDLATARTDRTPAEWAFYGVGFAATLAVTFFVTRLARRALREATLV